MGPHAVSGYLKDCLGVVWRDDMGLLAERTEGYFEWMLA